MTKTASIEEVIVLSKSTSVANRLNRLNPRHCSSASTLEQTKFDSQRDFFVISSEKALTDSFVRRISVRSRPRGRALLLYTPSLKALHSLTSFFRHVAFSVDSGLLERNELFEVLASSRKGELIIGGYVDADSETITLWTGELNEVKVPFSSFQDSGTETSPDFSKFSVIDFGQTIKLGDYEASTESILYENCPNLRKALKKRMANEDTSLGGAIKRLRKQRGLVRNEFGSVSEKTVARIERGEVKNVRDKTLQVIAQKLGVSIDQLKSF